MHEPRNVAETVSEAARATPDKVALIWQDQAVTWAQLDNRIDADQSDVGIAERQSEQIDANIALENKRIAGTSIFINRYRAEQGTVFASQARSISSSVSPSATAPGSRTR